MLILTGSKTEIDRVMPYRHRSAIDCRWPMAVAGAIEIAAALALSDRSVAGSFDIQQSGMGSLAGVETRINIQGAQTEGAHTGGGRADRAGDAAKQASPKGGRGQTQHARP